jgi:hypothetical protein
MEPDDRLLSVEVKTAPITVVMNWREGLKK